MAAIAIASCSSGGGDATSSTTVAGATTTEAAATTAVETTVEMSAELAINIEPNDEVNTLSAWVVIETPSPASVDVTVSSGDHAVTFQSDAVDEVSHRIPIFGMRPDRTYDIEATATTSDASIVGTTTFDAGSLPEDFPAIEVSGEPGDNGWTLFTVLQVPPQFLFGVGEQVQNYLIAVDETKEVVWYKPVAVHRLTDFQQTPDGTLTYLDEGRAGHEIDWMGNYLAEWRSREAVNDPIEGDHPVVELPYDSIHHTFYKTGNGTIITIGNRIDVLEMPDPGCTPEDNSFGANWDGELDVVSDIVLEVDAETGETVFEWSLVDYIEPAERLGWGQCTPWLLTADYEEFERRVDWSHANAAWLDEPSNTIILSMRHLDLLIGIRHTDDAEGAAGDMLWQFGTGGDVTLNDGAEPFAGQHAPEILEGGALILYDNGVGAAAAGVDPARSRALLYDFDPVALTATELESNIRFDDEGVPIVAGGLGDADMLESGNWLVVDGLIGGITGGTQVTEVDPVSDEVLFSIVVQPGELVSGIYRAERVVDPTDVS